MTMPCHCLQCICWHEFATFVLPASLSVDMLHAYKCTHLCPTLYKAKMCMMQWRYCHAGNSAQLTCNNPHCRVTLQYPRGASQVQCSLCNTINTAIDVSTAFLSSLFYDKFPAEPYWQDVAICFTCVCWFSCLAASVVSCTHLHSLVCSCTEA